MKKAIIALLSLVLFLSIFPTTVLASDNGYQPRLEAPSYSNKYYNSQLNWYSQTGYGMPNCVAYAYGRVYEMNKTKPLITHGNAGDWWFINKSGGYYKYGSTPKLGAVVVWSNHVAVVEKINKDKTITISESHYGGTYFDTKTVSDYTYHYGQAFYGFIYTYKEKVVKKVKPKTYKMEKSIFVPTETERPAFDTIKFVANDKNKNLNIVHNDKMLINTKQA